MADVNLTDLMAEHDRHSGTCGIVWVDGYEPTAEEVNHCLVYRLSADLVAAEERESEVRGFAEVGAVTARARGRFELERRWLDLLHIMDRAADQ